MQGCLTADLASDGAAASCHQYGLSRDIASDRLHMQVDRLSSEQVFYAHVAEHGDVYFLIDHLIDTRQHLDLARRLLADLQQSCCLSSFSVGIAMMISSILYFFCHGGNVFLAAHNGDSLQVCTDLIRIVVYDTGHFAVQVLAVLHLAHEHVSRPLRRLPPSSPTGFDCQIVS